MNGFELIFILFVFALLIALLAAIGLFVVGRGSGAVWLLCRLGICLGVYLAIVLLVSPLAPRQVVQPGEPICFDDWCITIHGVAPVGRQEFVVRAVITCRARMVPQREVGIVLYVIDAAQRRFDAVSLKGDVPFDIRLRPSESVQLSRTFKLPVGTQPAGVVVAHERGFPIGWLIIGEGPFGKPPMVQLTRLNEGTFNTTTPRNLGAVGDSQEDPTSWPGESLYYAFGMLAGVIDETRFERLEEFADWSQLPSNLPNHLFRAFYLSQQPLRS